MIIWTCVYFFALFGVGQAQQRETPSSITHQDIRDAILTLATAMRDIGSKLERHEARESLLATSQNKMLNTLDTRSKGAEKNLEGLLKIMTTFDDRIKKLETNMLQRDDSQRVQLQKVIDAVSRMPTTGSTAPTSTTEDNRIINRLMKKIDGFERSVLTRLPMIGNEVKIVGEKLDARSARIEQLQAEAKELASRKQTSETDTLKTAVSSILAGESRLIKAIGEFDGISTRLDSGVVSLSSQIARFNNDTSAILSSINSVHTSLDNITAAASVPAYAPFDVQELKEIDKNIKSTAASVDKVGEMVMSTSKMIKDIEKTTATELKDVKKMSEKTAIDVGVRLDRYMSEIVKKINDSQTTIQYQVSEAGDMAESLSERVEQGYKNISAEIRGLTNVEQVLLDTADSVMDTKRRLEYAVQQILLELGETVRKQTGNLHTELTKSVDNVTLTVLGQQGTAWKNLTTKLESELGQVWRQIGVLHQTAIQSQSILDKMETQTVSHINGTLKTLENMDGKVLIVTNRMGEVEENLNYLLGRLSLVVQEFNQIRGGLGDTLDSLRANMAVIHEKIPETKKSGTSPKSGDDLERRENMIHES